MGSERRELGGTHIILLLQILKSGRTSFLLSRAKSEMGFVSVPASQHRKFWHSRSSCTRREGHAAP